MREREDFSDLVHVMQRLICDADAPERLAEGSRDWLTNAGVTHEHADALAAVGDKRLLLYRKLVRGGLRSAIKAMIPRTAARLGPVFDEWVARFCTEEMPRSHYLRDVAFEFVAWVLPKWAGDETIADYIADLARHELFEFEISTAVSDGPESARAVLTLDKPVVFDASARLQRYTYAVFRLNEDEADREVPVREPTAILGYRDPAFELHYLELTPLAADILERLLEGESLGTAVLAAYGKPPPPEVLEEIARMLADLVDQGVLLGAS